MKKIILIILLYLFFLIETLLPQFFPKLSFITFLFGAFSLPIIFSTFLGFFLGFLLDLNNPALLGFNTFLFTFLGFLIPYFRKYFLPTIYNYFFSLIILFAIFSLVNRNFFILSFILTLLALFLFRKQIGYEKKI